MPAAPLAGMLGVDLGDDAGVSSFLSRYSDMAGSWGAKALESVTETGGMVAAAVMSIFLIPILCFYMLRDWDRMIARIAVLIPTSQRKTVYQLGRETDAVLGAFLRGQLLVMFGLACMYSAGLGLVGLKYAIAIGVVAGLVSFVPYLGFVFGITLATLTVAMEPDPLWKLVGVVATFSIAQMIEGSVLTPKLVGDRIGLHPVLVIFAIAAGGQLFGFFGILLALPAAAVLSVLVRFAYDRYLKESLHMDAESVSALLTDDSASDAKVDTRSGEV
jgi:predicted PurR-regulated permease PerM